MIADAKTTGKISEMRYLNADNADRYRCIMRIFYEQYGKLKYWLYQEDVYQLMVQDPYFQGYQLEQCQQDLTMLTEWKNLAAVQDTRNVRTVEEFRSRKFRYMMTEYSVEIERLVERLANLHIEGSSLEPSLLERIRIALEKFPEMANEDPEHVYSWWNDINNDFVRLNRNYQDYIRDLSSVKAEEMMKTEAFLIFKDRLIEYLRSFVKSLQKNAGIIGEVLAEIDEDTRDQVMGLVIRYELSIPRVDGEVTESELREKNYGRFESIFDWFVGRHGDDSEAGHLFDATNEIIRRITRYAARISEKNSLGVGRREEYRKVAELFLACGDLEEAHRMSAMVFGMERPWHLRSEKVRETDSMNTSVYDEAPDVFVLKSRVRGGREKENRTAISDTARERERVKRDTMRRLRRERKKLTALEENRCIDFAHLPVIEAGVRGILLRWLSDAMESPDHSARTEDGRNFHLDLADRAEKCVVHCEDGNFTMPHLRICFDNAEEG